MMTFLLDGSRLLRDCWAFNGMEVSEDSLEHGGSSFRAGINGRLQEYEARAMLLLSDADLGKWMFFQEQLEALISSLDTWEANPESRRKDSLENISGFSQAQGDASRSFGAVLTRLFNEI
jgi:hypothetical protein